MIGTGVFGTTGFMARDIGNPAVILLLWVCGGMFALLGAFCYAELGAAMPRAGGEYVYLRETYGPIWGFLSGWTSLTIGFSAAIASNAHLFATHFHQLFPALAPESPAVIGLAMVWGLTIVHVFGVRAGGAVQRLLTVVKVAFIVALVLAGLTVGSGDWGNLATVDVETDFTFATLLVSFLFVTFSYSGWNAASYIAGEMKDPGRSVPRSMIWGTVCVGTLYLALNVIYLYALPMPMLAADPVEPVAQKAAVAMFGPTAARWVTLMLCVSILGAASAMIWAGPRVYYAMATDGVFPKSFAQVSAGGGAPVRSIILQSVWISVLVLSARFEQLLIYAGFVLMAFTALAAAAVIVLRVKRPDLPRPYRVVPYPLVPALFLAVSIAVMAATLKIRPTESLGGILTVAVGVPFYFLWKRRSSHRSHAQPPSRRDP